MLIKRRFTNVCLLFFELLQRNIYLRLNELKTNTGLVALLSVLLTSIFTVITIFWTQKKETERLELSHERELEKHRQAIILENKIPISNELYSKLDEITSYPFTSISKDEWDETDPIYLKGMLEEFDFKDEEQMTHDEKYTWYIERINAKNLNYLNDKTNEALIFHSRNEILKEDLSKINAIRINLVAGVRKTMCIQNPNAPKEIEQLVETCKLKLKL